MFFFSCFFHVFLIFSTARYLADPAEERFNVETLSRLKVKVINRAYHTVILFLVGLIRHDKVKLDALFDVILLDDRELGKQLAFCSLLQLDFAALTNCWTKNRHSWCRWPHVCFQMF